MSKLILRGPQVLRRKNGRFMKRDILDLNIVHPCRPGGKRESVNAMHLIVKGGGNVIIHNTFSNSDYWIDNYFDDPVMNIRDVRVEYRDSFKIDYYSNLICERRMCYTACFKLSRQGSRKLNRFISELKKQI